MENELNNVKRDFHKNYNGIYLTDGEASLLKQRGFEISKYHSIKDLMFDLEEALENEVDDELEIILDSIAEFNYYHNTNK